MIWISFEINTLTICFILIRELYTQKENNSPSFVYYAVQVFTSLLVLWCMCKETSLSTIATCAGALFFKVGAWPFHRWYLKLISTLELFFYRIFLLITWQKLLPIFVVSHLLKEEIISIISILLVLASLFCPLWGFSDSLSFNRVIGLSSVNGNGWLILLIFCSFWGFLFFFIVYSYTLGKTLSLVGLARSKVKKLSEKSWWALTVTSNLGGLPPLPLFWAKILTLKLLLERYISKEITLLIIVVACYFLYLYLGVRVSTLIQTSFKNTVTSLKHSGKFIIFFYRIVGIVLLLFKKSV